MSFALGWVVGVVSQSPRVPECPSRLAAISCCLSALSSGSLCSNFSPEVLARDGTESALLPHLSLSPGFLRGSPLPRSGAEGTGSERLATASASSSGFPPSEATSPQPPFLFLIVIPRFTLQHSPGAEGFTSSLPSRFPVSLPPPRQRGNFLTPEQPFRGLSLFFPSPAPLEEPPRRRRKLRPHTFRSRAASESCDFRGCICVSP